MICPYIRVVNRASKNQISFDFSWIDLKIVKIFDKNDSIQKPSLEKNFDNNRYKNYKSSE